MNTLAQITDLHLDDFLAQHYQVDTRKNFLTVLDDVRRRGITDVVLTGDLGLPTSLDWLLKTIHDRGLTARYLWGNHDEAVDFAPRSEFKTLITDGLLFHKEILGTDLLLYLDSSHGPVNGVQGLWLDEQLALPEIERIFVFIHHPVLDCGGTTMDRLYPAAGRDALAERLASTKKPVQIYCGHYHTDHRQTWKNLTQSVTPAVVVQIKQHSPEIALEDKSFGYRIIRIAHDTVETDVVRFS